MSAGQHDRPPQRAVALWPSATGANPLVVTRPQGEPMSTQQMFVIKGLDPHAHLDLSTWTQQWYVSANLNIGDGRMLTGITEHRATPDGAVSAFYDRLVTHGLGEYVTNGRDGDERRNWEWNGGAFVEVSTDMLRAKYAVKEMS